MPASKHKDIKYCWCLFSPKSLLMEHEKLFCLAIKTLLFGGLMWGKGFLTHTQFNVSQWITRVRLDFRYHTLSHYFLLLTAKITIVVPFFSHNISYKMMRCRHTYLALFLFRISRSGATWNDLIRVMEIFSPQLFFILRAFEMCEVRMKFPVLVELIFFGIWMKLNFCWIYGALVYQIITRVNFSLSLWCSIRSTWLICKALEALILFINSMLNMSCWVNVVHNLIHMPFFILCWWSSFLKT